MTLTEIHNILILKIIIMKIFFSVHNLSFESLICPEATHLQEFLCDYKN